MSDYMKNQGLVDAATGCRNRQRQLEAQIERVETFNRANWAALQEAQRQIERLRKQKQIAVDALFSICQSDWGVGHSLAKPAHKAIEKLTALEADDG